MARLEASSGAHTMASDVLPVLISWIAKCELVESEGLIVECGPQRLGPVRFAPSTRRAI